MAREENGNGGGVPWKNIAIWALGIALGLVGWELTRQITRADTLQLERWSDHYAITSLQGEMKEVKEDNKDIKTTLQKMKTDQDDWQNRVWPVIQREFGSSLTFPRGRSFDNGFPSDGR